MTAKLREKIQDRREKRQKARNILKLQVFGSFPKIFSFLFWMLCIFFTPFYDKQRFFIEMVFEVGLYFFLLNSLTSFIIGQKWDNILGLVLNFTAAFLLFWFVGAIEILIYIGYAYLIFQELLTFQESTPIIKTLNKKLGTYKIKKPGVAFIIILILFTLGQNYLRFFVFINLEEALEETILFWELADFLATVTIIIFFLIFRKRNDELHQNLKTMLIWVFIIVKILAIPIAYDLYRGISDQESFEIANVNIFIVIRIIFLSLLVIWDLAKEVAENSYDESKRKHNTIFNLLYSIAIFSNYVDVYGYGRLNSMYTIIFIGLGVILLVRKLADDTAKVHYISNYRFLRKKYNIAGDIEDFVKK